MEIKNDLLSNNHSKKIMGMILDLEKPFMKSQSNLVINDFPESGCIYRPSPYRFDG